MRFGQGIGRDNRFVSIAGYGDAFDEAACVLAAHGVHRQVVARDPAERAHPLDLLVAYGLVIERRRRLHRDEGQELKQVVLDDVAHRAGMLVVAGALLDTDRLGHRDLNVVDVLAAPEQRPKTPPQKHAHEVLSKVSLYDESETDGLIPTRDPV